MKIAAISVADVFEVMGGWPAEQQGLFLQMILKMHARSGGLPDEDGELARMFGFKDVRTFKAIKGKLLARKVISIKDGELVNDRAMREIGEAKQRRTEAVEHGRKGGRPKAEAAAIASRSQADREPIASRSQADREPISSRSQADLVAIHDRSHMQQAAKSTTCYNPSPSPSPSPSPNNKKKEESSSLPPAAAREPEPAGWLELKSTFNGSTELMLADVQAWMGPTARRDNAIRWLTGTLAAYGASRTAQAWTIVTTKIASGQPVASPLPLWAKTAAGLTTAKPAKSVEPMRFDPLTPLNLRPVLQEPCL